jgi:putative membrane protein
METIVNIFIGFISILHLYFLWLEMFVWTTVGKKTFRNLPADMFEKTKALAANQGLYNGFLAAGLVWSLLIRDNVWSENVAIFFLSCVLLAGLFGWYSVSVRIFYIQSLPALIALILLLVFKVG